jgi:hypothetical protein
VMDLQERHRAGIAGGPNERNAHFVRGIEEFDQDVFGFLEFGRVADENARELIETGIVHMSNSGGERRGKREKKLARTRSAE